MATLPFVDMRALAAEIDAEEDSDDELGPLPYFERKQSNNSARRVSLCAEVDTFKDLDELTLETVAKTAEQQERILNVINQNILFSGCDMDEKQYIMETMFERKLAAGETVIKQGDEGDNFYVVDDGTLDIFVKTSEEEEGDGAHVHTVQPGESFGELALMYNCPRAATVKAVSECSLWAMDRHTFRRILMDTTMVKRNLYESFLEHVPMLGPLNKYERLVVADALEGEIFNDQDVIIRQGDEGDHLYIVEEGEAICTKSINGAEPVVVKELVSGDHFGELSLITNQPRAANVIAKGRLKVVRMSRDAFTRLLGPCDDLLKRGMDEYAAVNQKFLQEGEAFNEDELQTRLDKLEVMAHAFLEEIAQMRTLVRLSAKNVRRESYELQAAAAEAAIQQYQQELQDQAQGKKAAEAAEADAAGASSEPRASTSG